tara:strand:+ start:129 stop:383 length:255 start_codon:yes stop_codon:yes gene_type:complete
MRKVSLKTADENITLQIIYDVNVNLYTIFVISKKKGTQTYSELNSERALKLLNEKSSQEVDPRLPIVTSAISKGIDPSTIIGIS